MEEFNGAQEHILGFRMLLRYCLFEKFSRAHATVRLETVRDCVGLRNMVIAGEGGARGASINTSSSAGDCTGDCKTQKNRHYG